jgi:predicted RNase H-like HicB family nuclease
VISYSEDDKVYYPSVPSIEGCTTFSDTVEKAMKHIREAAEAMVEAMMEEGWNLPGDRQNIEFNMPIHLATLPA